MNYRLLFPAILIALLLTVVPFGFNETEAEQSDEPDEGGYMYTDSGQPPPVIDCDYMVLKGDPDATGWDTRSQTALTSVSLPFSFKYYGKYYSSVYISQYGAFSFVEKTGTTYRNERGYSIPSTSSPKGVIAVYWTSRDDCYSEDRDKLFTMETTINGNEVFIIEWNTRNNNNQYQAVLHRGGLISFQYSSVTGPWGGPVGDSVIIGIEKPDGSCGIEYQGYEWVNTDIFIPPFAIAYHAEEVHLEDTGLINGDGFRGDMIYAGSKPYIFRGVVSHSDDRDSIRVVSVDISPFNEKIKVICYPLNRTFKQLTGSRKARLDPEGSSVEIIDGKRMQIDFALDFNITYPSEKPRNVSFTAMGDLALPDGLDAGKLYQVENDLEWSGDELLCHTADGKSIMNNDYVAGGRTIYFTNKRIVYENSDVQPSPRTVQVNITDNWDNRITTFIPRGRGLTASWYTIQETAQMQFEFRMAGISYFNIVSYPSFTFQVRTDVDKPDTVSNLVIYPDVFGENESSIDNDRSVHVGWDQAEDGSSGIGGYIIKAIGENFSCRDSVPSSVTSYHMGLRSGFELPEGEVNISVTAVDFVGNIGDPAWTAVHIDLTGPSFTILDPGPDSWAVGTSPDIRVGVRDALSTVNGPSLHYRFSRDNGSSWGEWKSCSVYSTNLPEVEFVIKPYLSEGVDNLIQFNGEDMIGSGAVTSDISRIRVDGHRPTIRMEYPRIGSNGTTLNWLPKGDAPIKILVDDGTGSGLDELSVTYSISTDGGGNFSVEVPARIIMDNSDPGYPVHSFTTGVVWPEGDRNILRITASDNAGRTAVSDFRIRIDTTPDVNLIMPEYLGSYPGNLTVDFHLEASDPDGDRLEITWISNIDGTIGTGNEFKRGLTPGDHIITVIVRDGVHEIRKVIPITIRDVLSEDVNSIDSDGDGMSDGFELKYGLDIHSDDSIYDPDGDNYTNYMEFLAGTDPLSGSSYPGSSVTEESLDVVPIIVFSVSLVLLIALTLIMLRESRKEPAHPMNSPQIYR